VKTLVLLLVVATVGSPQSSATKGKQIIAQAIAALGGERFLQMQNRVASGRIYSFFHDELNGLDVVKTYSEYLPQKPEKGVALREREVLGKKQDYSYLFLMNQAWDVTYRGARPVDDETWERYVRTTENDIFYILRIRHDEPGMTYDYVGSDVNFSTHVEIVDITDGRNQTVRVYFDHNTMLPVRETYTWMDADTKQRNDAVTQYDKYRDAGGGVMWPFTIQRERNGYKTYQMFAASVQVNQPMPPKIFELPPGAKVLKKVE
jgi:hypothetical protein